MTTSIDLASLRERVRDALDWSIIIGHLGLPAEPDGSNTWKMCCQFHGEKTPSFRFGGTSDKFRDRCHCFACGEGDHDFFGFWEKVCGVDHLEAVKQLAGLAGVYYGELKFEKPKAPPVRTPEKRLGADDEAAEKPSLPPLWAATREDCEAIAKGRGLHPEAVWIAARAHRRVAVVKSWPLYESKQGSNWWPKSGWEQHRCWAAIDPTRNVAEFRRLDNELHRRLNGEAGPKAWSTKGKNWPLGAGQIGDRKRVLMVEGGPDMLAAYHFLQMWHTQRRPLLQDVAVVCMLGAGNRIRETALPFFKGCRVRIMVDADVPKDSEEKGKRKLTGLEAAARWTAQLTEAGAAVECYYVGDQYAPHGVAAWHAGEIKAADIEIIQEGFKLPDGRKAKDTNELALCADDVTTSDEVREAFTTWDF